MAQSVITVPQRTLQPGTAGPFTSSGIPTNVTQVVAQIDLTQWPATPAGSPVLDFAVGESVDGGTTWSPLLSGTIPAQTLGTNKFTGQPITATGVTITLQNPGAPQNQHRLQVSLTAHVVVTTAATILVQ